MKQSSAVKSFINAPYLLWSVLFIIAPMIMVVYYAFTDRNGDWTLANITSLGAYSQTFIRSIWYAFVATLICLVLDYPLAYIMSRSSISKQRTIMMLVMLPMWMNFLIRTYSWITLLANTGIINTLLSKIGIGPLHMINTPGAVILGMIYNFLPFMVLPLFNVLTKIDENVLNAARDLGANSAQVFFKVTLPLSLPGIISGVTMVFVPSLTTFAISDLLGARKIMLIGNIIEQEFSTADNWHLGSGLSLVLMVFILISMAVLEHYDKNGEGTSF